MKRLFMIIGILGFVFTLSGCDDEASNYNFRPRQNDYYISEDGNVIIDYKTDENGELTRFNIDRLLTIEEMLSGNPTINYQYELEGFEGDIFVEPPLACLMPRDVLVPVNIEVGSIRYKFRSSECMYKEVGRDNEFKNSSFAREYGVKDTIQESKDTAINIVVYDPDSIELFVEIYELPHTLETLGVFAIELSPDTGNPIKDYLNFSTDMKIYEQYMIRFQDNESVIDEIYGLSEDINILNFGDLTEVQSVIEDFEDTYEVEIQAVYEFEAEVGINQVEEEIDGNPDDNPDDIPEDEEGNQLAYGDIDGY